MCGVSKAEHTSGPDVAAGGVVPFLRLGSEAMALLPTCAVFAFKEYFLDGM